ncbi:hypothetical protein Cgig2_030441 [Carnegiea gigantea]|uniref:Uncharacterized protein n=1 Tax=Carnegiea gigantea TaxID=171969 RepID=A0A9Q1QP42_9CARY|nr:hypothetical protein Cgig2_030441 [Carnegiea gigantea]
MLYLCRWCRYNDVVGVWLVLWTKEVTVLEEQAVVGREVFVYVCWGEYLEHGGNSMLTYHGGSSDCILVRENIGLGHVVKVVEEMIDEGLRERGMWYTMKFYQNVLMSLQRDGDVVKSVIGNDEFSYMYVGEKKGLIQRSMQEKPNVGAAKLKGECKVAETDHTVRNDGRRSSTGVMTRVEHANVGQQGLDGDEAGAKEEVVDDRELQSLRRSPKRKAELQKWENSVSFIRREKKWVYDYVSVCYKGPMQATCYMNIVHPMETNDMASVDDRIGHVAGGDSLDDDYHRRILPPLNPRKRGRPQSKRRES